MDLAEQSVYKTLSLLVMLSRQFRLPNLSDAEKATLTISKQYLTDNNLTVSEFTNALHLLSSKGYIWHVIIFDDHLRAQMEAFVNLPTYGEIMKQLETLNTQQISDQITGALEEDIKKLLPKNVPVNEDDFEDLKNEKIQITQLMNEGFEIYKKLRADEVGLVILMPFRDIQDLYSRMGKGEKFDDIQDDGLWYDPMKHEFHIDGEIVSTSYQGKPNVEHEVLLRLAGDFEEGVIWYDDIENRSPRSLKDALLKFVNKNYKLKKIFTVHSDRLEFSKEAFK